VFVEIKRITKVKHNQSPNTLVVEALIRYLLIFRHEKMSAPLFEVLIQ